MADITIQQVREKYPQYKDMSDAQLADALHAKFYADMPKEQFYAKIGLGVVSEPAGFGRNVLSGVARGAADMSTPSYAQDRAGEIGSMAPTVPQLPTAQETESGFQSMGAVVEPTSLLDRYVQSGVRGATAGLLGGGPAGAVGGTLSGVGMQTAREFNAPRWVEIAAGLGLPLLAGGIAATWKSTAPNSQRQLGQALQGATEQEMRAAEGLMRQSQQAGNPVTWSEALNQVSNGRFPQLAQIQRVVEQSPGGTRLGQMNAERLDAARGQAQTQLNRIGPMPQGQALQDVPTNLHQAATGVINQAVRDMRGITRPIYETARTQTTPAAQMEAIIARLDDEIARTGSDQVRQQLIAFRRDLVDAPAQPGTPPQTTTATGTRPGTRINRFTPAQEGAPEQFVLDVGRLDSIRKAWRDRIELPDPNVNAAAVPKEAAAKIGPILSDLRTMMGQSSRAYKSGRAFHQQAMRDAIEPLQRGQIGQISQGQPNLAGQKSSLLPVGQQGVIDPQTIAATVRQLEQQSPGAARDWLRTNLQSEWDEILSAFKTSGSDQSRGASLWARLAGNEGRRANLQAYVNALDNTGQTWRGFEHMLQILDAQRYRLPANSATAFNQETIAALKGKGIPVSLEDINPISALQGEVKQASQLRRYRINSESLTEILLNPDSATRLRALAGMNPSTSNARLLAGSLLSTMMPNDRRDE